MAPRWARAEDVLSEPRTGDFTMVSDNSCGYARLTMNDHCMTHFLFRTRPIPGIARMGRRRICDRFEKKKKNSLTVGSVVISGVTVVLCFIVLRVCGGRPSEWRRRSGFGATGRPGWCCALTNYKLSPFVVTDMGKMPQASCTIALFIFRDYLIDFRRQ
jgi:hypothetical protein